MEPEGSVSTRACHWSLFWVRCIQSTPSHSIYVRSILILSPHLRLGLPNDVFPSDFLAKILYAFLPYLLHHACYMPRPQRSLNTRIINTEEGWTPEYLRGQTATSVNGDDKVWHGWNVIMTDVKKQSDSLVPWQDSIGWQSRTLAVLPRALTNLIKSLLILPPPQTLHPSFQITVPQ